jgi:serine/threonine-protein kinase RIO1
MERTMESGNMMSQGGLEISTPVYNSLKEAKKVQIAYENRVRGNRADKSTSEQVLDQTTRVNLLKLLNSGVLSDLNGIISTGKEANVYYAKAGNKLEPDFAEGTEYAIKIYKTTLNEFKNRSEYIEGEFRFRHSKKVNERKLIKLWAEKGKYRIKNNNKSIYRNEKS